jgi:hypothetical protein
MSLTFEEDIARLTDLVTVDDAENLLAWLATHPNGRVDLAGMRHLHAANLQVLMAARPVVANWPDDPDLHAWLVAALHD